MKLSVDELKDGLRHCGPMRGEVDPCDKCPYNSRYLRADCEDLSCDALEYINYIEAQLTKAERR